MLELPNVTLFSIVHDGNNDMHNRVARVMNWCMSIIKFRRAILLTRYKPEVECKAEIFQFPLMDLIPGVQTFIVHMLGLLDLGEYALGVHEDGFPLDPCMWSDEFLKHDYIGSPWGDGVVGNNGFYITSKKFRECSANLPFVEGVPNSDNYYCRDHKPKMEEMGVTYAPLELAARFSTECIYQEMATFGFHGRAHCAHKYAKGWELIDMYEKGRK